MTASHELQPPVLLAAMPQVQDPFFHQSVVLLLHHDEEGSFGFIVNRPTDIRVADILEGMKIGWAGAPEALAYFGGPVRPQVGTVLFAGEPLSTIQAAAEIVPGLRTTQHASDLETLAGAPPNELRLLLGYAGWGGEQLMEEILRNDWLLAPVRQDLVFSQDYEGTWEETLRSVGVDPSNLPAWTAAHNGEPAN